MKDNELLFAKTNPNAIIPTKRDEDGCYDIYACFDEDGMIILPHTNRLIPTGIASAFSPKWRLAIRERGSNTKANMITMAGQVDSGYRGEIFVSIYNGSNNLLVIDKDIDKVAYYDDCTKVPYTKAIAQFAMEEVPILDIKEISYDELKNISSERGVGKLGSSQK
jgi:dUTPase